MYFQIDTDTTALYWDSIVNLEGIEYLFEFFWNDRDSSWWLNILDQDENPIACAIKLVVCRAENIPQTGGLLRRFVDPRLPPGVLYLVDLSLQDAEIAAPADLGTRCPLMYITSDDPDLVGVNVRGSFA